MSSQETIREPINPGSLDNYVAISDRSDEEAFGEWCLLLTEFRQDLAQQQGIEVTDLHGAHTTGDIV